MMAIQMALLIDEETGELLAVDTLAGDEDKVLQALGKFVAYMLRYAACQTQSEASE